MLNVYKLHKVKQLGYGIYVGCNVKEFNYVKKFN